MLPVCKLSQKRKRQKVWKNLKNDKTAIDQERVLEEATKSFQKAKIYLKGGIDTAGIGAELKLIDHDFVYSGRWYFYRKGHGANF